MRDQPRPQRLRNVGAYAGLVLEHFDYGDLTSYLTGTPVSAYWPDRGVIAVLGCDCDDVGCWPMEAQVLLDDDLAIRRGFGPFVFRRNQYEHAVRKAVSATTLAGQTTATPG